MPGLKTSAQAVHPSRGFPHLNGNRGLLWSAYIADPWHNIRVCAQSDVTPATSGR